MATAALPPNYYAILGVSESATVKQIRDAYKRAALKTHPDRVDADSPERPVRTRKFQLINDAYYTLSDPGRRREYDAQRRLFGTARSSRSSSTSSAGRPTPSSTPGEFPDPDFGDISDEDAEDDGTAAGAGDAKPQGFSWAWNFFRGQATDSEARRQAGNAQFGDVFEEMLREEGMGPDAADAAQGRGVLGQFWGMIGGFSGGALGFIVANLPGLVAGAVAGNRLGAVRDARGKSVYAVFQELPPGDRSRLLSQLAAKVFSHAVGV